MKKLIIALFLPGVFLLLNKEATAQVRFGAKAGLNVSSIALPLNDYAPKIGYQVGFVADIKLSDHFSIQPALLLSSKGVVDKYEDRDLSGLYVKTIRTKVSLNYLEVPILALYKRPLKNGTRIFVGLGPYVGIGMFGYSRTEEYGKHKIAFDSDPRQDVQSFVPFDFGVSTTVGIETRKFLLGVNFNNGVKPIANGTTNYNSTLGLTAGYFIDR